MIFKAAFEATDTSKKTKISLIASLDIKLSSKRITKSLTSLRICSGWSVLLLLSNHADRFSGVEAQKAYLYMSTFFLFSSSESDDRSQFGRQMPVRYTGRHASSANGIDGPAYYETYDNSQGNF